MKKRVRETYQSARGLFVWLVVIVGLSGCAGAAYVGQYALSAASVGHYGYGQYKLSSGGSASFEVDQTIPSETALSKIQFAESIVI